MGTADPRRRRDHRRGRDQCGSHAGAAASTRARAGVRAGAVAGGTARRRTSRSRQDCGPGGRAARGRDRGCAAARGPEAGGRVRFTKPRDLIAAALVAGVVLYLIMQSAYGSLPPLPTLAGVTLVV